jgi:Sec-independent protein translocase protein TatA
MGLFSDLDWIIIAAVAAFLLFGRGNGEAMRTIGRWYARAVRLKQELLSEVTKAAELPALGTGGGASLRGVLLGLDPVPAASAHVPLHVRTPPAVAMPTPPPAGVPWTGGEPVLCWSVTGAPPHVGEGFR